MLVNPLLKSEKGCFCLHRWEVFLVALDFKGKLDYDKDLNKKSSSMVKKLEQEINSDTHQRMFSVTAADRPQAATNNMVNLYLPFLGNNHLETSVNRSSSPFSNIHIFAGPSLCLMWDFGRRPPALPAAHSFCAPDVWLTAWMHKCKIRYTHAINIQAIKIWHHSVPDSLITDSLTEVMA